MYMLMPPIKHNLLNYYSASQPCENVLNRNILKTVNAITKIGGKIYHLNQIDQNSFSQISQLTGNAKIKFLESMYNS